MRLLSTIMLVSLIAFSSGCASTKANTEMVGRDVPFVRFQSIDGQWHILDEFKGQTVVLVFWAQWCSRSRSSIQSLNELARRNKGSSDRVYLAVNIDKQSDEQKFRDFIRDVPIDAFTHSYSGNDVYDEAFVRMNGEELPHIFIINPTGKVAAVGHSEKFVYEYFHEMK